MSRFRTDRRLAGRYKVKTPLRVRLWKSLVPECTAESVNLSQRGIYFATDAVLRKGETVEVLFNMPEEIVGEPASEWRCTGHVVRRRSRLPAESRERECSLIATRCRGRSQWMWR